MFNPIVTFKFTATGALFFWITQGFKGSFNDQMVSVDERNSAKGTKRYYLGMFIWIVVAVVVYLMART